MQIDVGDTLERDRDSHYWAGIGVMAYKLGIGIVRISAGHPRGSQGQARLQPIEKWCDVDVRDDFDEARPVEGYAMTLLAGSAATYIRTAKRRNLSREGVGNSGLELAFLREVWRGSQPEPDRAMAIICGSLGAFDGGDLEATAMKLWRRAVWILRRQPHFQRLRMLAWKLSTVEQLTGDEIAELFQGH